MRLYRDGGVLCPEACGGGFGLELPDLGIGVENLALEVGPIHTVAVDHADRAHSRRREVLEGGAAQPSRSDHGNGCGLEPCLPGTTDLGEEEVPGIALVFVGSERHA